MIKCLSGYFNYAFMKLRKNYQKINQNNTRKPKKIPTNMLAKPKIHVRLVRKGALSLS